MKKTIATPKLKKREQKVSKPKAPKLTKEQSEKISSEIAQFFFDYWQRRGFGNKKTDVERNK